MYMTQGHVLKICGVVSTVRGRNFKRTENWKLLQGMRIPCLVDKKGVMDFVI
jgi:hypothetical protein